MNLTELKEIDQRYRATKPKLFLLSAPDRCADERSLAEVESQIGMKLSASYRDFLRAFGGGLFGFVNVFSADLQSDYYLPSRIGEASGYLPPGLLPFSDDNAGGLYVLKVTEGKAGERVYYWNTDGGLNETQFGDVMEFVARFAYEPA